MHSERPLAVGPLTPRSTHENQINNRRTMIESQEQETGLQQWQLDGNSAEAYERYLVPLLFAPGAETLIEMADLEPGERVLDVACGTGIVARRAAPHVGSNGRVVGLDVNEGMLEVAKSTSADIEPAITWQQGDAMDLPFSDATFDVVFCQQGLQFVDDRAAALHEMYLVLASEGRLALSIMRPIEYNPGYAALVEVLDDHLGPEAGAMMRSPFAAYSTEDLRALITEAGFQEETLTIGIGPVRYPSAEEFLRQEAASSPLAGPVGALNEKKRRAMVEDLEIALRPYRDDNGVVFPASTYLGLAHR